MYKSAKENTVNRFRVLEKAFQEKKLPEGGYGKITEDGITGFCDFQYKKGETVEEYLARNRIISKYKYPAFAYAYLCDGEYVDEDSSGISDYNKRRRIWHKKLNRYIKSLDDDTVLVGVDCHI